MKAIEAGLDRSFDSGTSWPAIARATKLVATLLLCLGLAAGCAAAEPIASPTELPKQSEAWTPCAASDHISKTEAESSAKSAVLFDGFVVSEIVSSELIDRASAVEMGLAETSGYACYWYVQVKGKGDPNIGVPPSAPMDAPPTRTPRAAQYYATAEILMDAVSGFVVRTILHSGQIVTPDPDWSPQRLSPSFPTPTSG